MGWAKLSDETVLISINLPAGVTPELVKAVRGTGFASRAAAMEHKDPHERGTDLLKGRSWKGQVLELRKKDLAEKLDPSKHPGLLLEVSFGEGVWSLYAMFEWHEGESFSFYEPCLQSLQLTCVSAAVSVGFDATVSSVPAYVFVNELPQAPPEGWERVFLSGGNRKNKTWGKSPYPDQVRTLLLVQEFSEEKVVRYEKAGSVHTYEGQQLSGGVPSRHDDHNVVTHITANSHSAQSRITYVRLFPPLEPVRRVSRANLAAKRPWGQWYPVYRIGSQKDPHTDKKKGIERLYKYLKWIAGSKEAKGRVRMATVVSHAIVSGPSQICGGGGKVEHLQKLGKGRGIEDALGKGALFWITGCNSHLNEDVDEKPERKAINNVEGILRARIRLKTGLEPIVQALEGDQLDSARTRIKALLAEDADHTGFQAWQVPGKTEGGELRQAKPTYGDRDGTKLKSLKGGDPSRAVSAHLKTLKDWAESEESDPAPESPTQDEAKDAAEAVLEALEWSDDKSSFQKTIKVKGEHSTETIETWLEASRKNLDAKHHYAAAFAKMAHQAGRKDIRVWGGNPGMGGEHLRVSVLLDDDVVIQYQEGGEKKKHAQEISAYYRQPSWSAYSWPWTLAYYRRFGLEPQDFLGYFRYDYATIKERKKVDDLDLETLHPVVT